MLLVQPLIINEEPAVLGPDGKHCMKALYRHAVSRGHEIITAESGAAEECEREVQQQEEEVAEDEVDREISLLEPGAERDWSNVKAVLKMRSVAEFRPAQEKILVGLQAGSVLFVCLGFGYTDEHRAECRGQVPMQGWI